MSTHPGQLSVRTTKSGSGVARSSTSSDVCRLKGLPWWGQRGQPPKRKAQSEVHSHGLQVNISFQPSEFMFNNSISPFTLGTYTMVLFYKDTKTDPPKSYFTLPTRQPVLKGFQAAPTHSK